MLIVRPQALSGQFLSLKDVGLNVRSVHSSAPTFGQSMEKKREKAMLKKAGGKPSTKKKDAAAPATKAKIKMKDAELLVKAAPLLRSQDNLDSIELHGAIQETLHGMHWDCDCFLRPLIVC
jgi:hypothetical protein